MKVSTCDLAHLRNAGHLRFSKTGSAYLYDVSDCQRLATLRHSPAFNARAQEPDGG
jgi:hypothetical protein